MKIILLILVSLVVSACYKPTTIANTMKKNTEKACMQLSENLSDKHHIWIYYPMHPQEKNVIRYYFNISDFLLLGDNTCGRLNLVLSDVDVSSRLISTGGKGGAVGVFKPKVKVLFYDNQRLVLTKTYATEARSKRYNWNTQKTIKKYHAEAFSKGMQEIQRQIVADLKKLEHEKQERL